MIIIRAILLLLNFTIIPVAVGRLITYKAEESIHSNPIVIYMTGLFGSWGIFFVLFAFFEGYQNWNTFVHPYLGCFSALVRVYSVVITVLACIGLILLKNSFSIKKPINLFRLIMEHKLTAVYALIFAIILLVQLYFAYGYQINKWSYDDYEYVVSSLDNIDTDSINYVNPVYGSYPFTLEKRSVASWTTYISYLSVISGFEVTTISHTILPVLLLLITYLVYYYMSQIMFEEIESRLIFLILLGTLFSFGLYSHFSVTFRVLCAIWQGKGVLAAIGIPFLFTYLVQLYSGDYARSNLVAIIAVSMGLCSFTQMSAFIITAIQVLMWVVVSIRNRKVFHLGYLLAGLVGPAFQMIFYAFIYRLMLDMKGLGPRFFKSRFK